MQEVNQLSSLKMIDDKFDELFDSVKKLYDENIHSPIWNEKLTQQIDLKVIYPDRRYFDFQLNTSNEIHELLGLELRNDFDEYLTLRLDELNQELLFLSLNTLGTTLNVMREFYTDILRDLKLHYVV